MMSLAGQSRLLLLDYFGPDQSVTHLIPNESNSSASAGSASVALAP